VAKPVSAPAIPTIDHNIPSDTQFVITTVKSANLADPLTGINLFNKEVEESLHSGPQSFVDSERVNAGIEVSGEIDEDIIKNIPTDLWREDIAGIKTHCRKVKKVKLPKKNKGVAEDLETATPSDPELVIE
jgi:hypothetical protein